MVHRHKTSPSTRKFEVIASARKALSTIFWDMKGVVHMEFLKQGHTVNSEKYISTLRTLRARLRRVRSGRDSILQHDNARPHTSRQTQDALAQLKLPALPHPAYSPDLAPSDYSGIRIKSTPRDRKKLLTLSKVDFIQIQRRKTKYS